MAPNSAMRRVSNNEHSDLFLLCGFCRVVLKLDRLGVAGRGLSGLVCGYALRPFALPVRTLRVFMEILVATWKNAVDARI